MHLSVHLAEQKACSAQATRRASSLYPDPLAVRAGELGKEGDFWEAAKECEEEYCADRIA